jgi:hypothetical protein
MGATTDIDTVRDSVRDARIVRLGGGDTPLEIGPVTFGVFLWTSALALTFMAEVVFGLVTSSVHAAWLVTGARASSWSAVWWSLLVFALPLPGVVIYTSVWWLSLRREGSRSGPKASVVVVLSLLAGAVVGAFMAVTTWNLTGT